MKLDEFAIDSMVVLPPVKNKYIEGALVIETYQKKLFSGKSLFYILGVCNPILRGIADRYTSLADIIAEETGFRFIWRINAWIKQKFFK